MNASGLTVPFTAQSASESTDIINQVIHAWQESTEKKDSFVEWLVDEAKQKLLPLSELDWLKGNDRACYWVWLTLVRGGVYGLSVSGLQEFVRPAVLPHIDYSRYALQLNTSNPLNSAPSQPQVPPYDKLGLKLQTSSTMDRFEEVVKFFDRSGQSLGWQLDLVNRLESNWGRIFSARKPLSWLQSNDEMQCRWAWEYLTRPSFDQNLPSVSYLHPTGTVEMYLAIFAAFDTWDAIPNLKRLFLNDFNKAWQQKKHRDNRQGKKVCNLVLREEVKEMLDEMAASRGIRLNQLVEALIEREYESR
ncbi:hypothetical protein NFHSH190041_35300 [Shewanella sp. NFH-SH190041]|uniref:hypothetical protein n=1 Tax=Shewanella sp. NFH-SH190041 TaxID=2950245 RepID=UPI0021C3E65F|nr:hypothetical protein [Shewanella sp. NFH-SH190041]BDM66078.1 hypothetical protein NFHSH190041_35300 [Shewanella sp. NFH-SH190041]